jgi:hypothetical protein
MTYDLTNLYSGGLMGYLHQLMVLTDYILLDVLSIVVFVVVYGVGSARQREAKNNMLLSTFLTFCFVAVFALAVAATTSYGAGVLQLYSTRVIVWFVITVAVLLHHVISDIN